MPEKQRMNVANTLSLPWLREHMVSDDEVERYTKRLRRLRNRNAISNAEEDELLIESKWFYGLVPEFHEVSDTKFVELFMSRASSTGIPAPLLRRMVAAFLLPDKWGVTNLASSTREGHWLAENEDDE